MKRTQLQLDDATWEAVRRQAFVRRTSAAGIVREALHRYLVTPPAAQRSGRPTLPGWVASGRSGQRSPKRPVSVFHDDALVEALGKELRAHRHAA